MDWIRHPDPVLLYKACGLKGDPPVAAWKSDNNCWAVLAYSVPTTDGTPWEGTLRVGIKHVDRRGRDREVVENWSFLQAIKEKLFPGRLAIEIYPPASQLVDVAPMRWLWLLPPDARLPISLSGAISYVGGAAGG